jgi:hypothetical protein
MATVGRRVGAADPDRRHGIHSRDAVQLDRIDRKARVWIVTLGPDGKLVAELDPRRIAKLRLAA